MPFTVSVSGSPGKSTPKAVAQNPVQEPLKQEPARGSVSVAPKHKPKPKSKSAKGCNGRTGDQVLARFVRWLAVSVVKLGMAVIGILGGIRSSSKSATPEDRLAELESLAKRREADAEYAEKEASLRKRIAEAETRISATRPSKGRTIQLPDAVRKHWGIGVALLILMLVVSMLLGNS